MRKFFFVFILLAGALLSLQASTVTYVQDNTTLFKNPERGFTNEFSRKVSVNKPNVLKGEVADNYGAKYYMSLLVVLYNFGNFKESDLPEKILTAFDEDMQVLRNNGWKCVLRFAYTESEEDNVDAKIKWVKRHLEQLKPHLKANADVIYVLEAGFVGVWGEWYYSANYGNETQHMNDKRRQVIDALFANAPEDRFILFRYPMIQWEYLNDKEPVTAEEAFTGTVKSRMGCHNDAFLNTYGDMGTYASDNHNDDPKVRQYVTDQTFYVPNGGETNLDDKDETLAEQRYTRAPAEMSAYHWSFCGAFYALPVTNRWRESGLFDTLNIHMGYRYNMVDAQFSDAAAPGGKMNMTVRIKNSGYAPIYNERKAYLVLKNAQKEYRIQLAADPRRWLPNGIVCAINEQVTISDEVAEGAYKLYLYLPDVYASIAADPRYAVRFANKDVWDSATGYNDLKAQLTVSKTAPADPGVLPDIPTQAVEEVCEPMEKPKKMLENGIFYILMPNGKKVYCF